MAKASVIGIAKTSTLICALRQNDTFSERWFRTLPNIGSQNTHIRIRQRLADAESVATSRNKKPLSLASRRAA